jgi:hypothetical protein
MRGVLTRQSVVDGSVHVLRDSGTVVQLRDVEAQEASPKSSPFYADGAS